jgi:large subunit ribosomal protein L7/L12
MTTEQLVDEISNLSVKDLVTLVEALKERFGVTAVPVAAGSGSAPGPAATAPAEEAAKTSFDLILLEAGDQKVPLIKLIKQITGLGLKESRDLVESLPKPIKQDIPYADAEEIKKQLEEIGAKTEIK